jgi:hypothetical protein
MLATNPETGTRPRPLAQPPRGACLLSQSTQPPIRATSSGLRAAALAVVAQFSNYRRVLNRNIWSSRWLSRHLFRLLVEPTPFFFIIADHDREFFCVALDRSNRRGAYLSALRPNNGRLWVGLPSHVSSKASAEVSVADIRPHRPIQRAAALAVEDKARRAGPQRACWWLTPSYDLLVSRACRTE